MATAWNHLEVVFGSRMRGRVLDAGCSNGDYTLFLRALPRVGGVVSLDIQPIDVRHHGKSFAENVPDGYFVQGDVQDLPFEDDEFDSILCWDMLQNVPDALKAFREFARVTKIGGLVTVRTIIKRNVPWVIPGVTPETGSSGHTFINHTVWDPHELIGAAHAAGLCLTDYHVDPWNHQTGLFVNMKAAT